ncbi:MAG: cupredoxin domain-containing protein [Candidatus Diapherotrites archaeon]|nr:cupredoxin domain-containing protein [Candidatus Diapherotrites archaeon]
MALISYVFAFLISILIIGAAGIYVWINRKELNEMCCMMVGMIFGTVSGFSLGLIYVIPTGDYLTGTILGTIFGVIVGIPFGRIGGPLGRMEGVMAGIMGGTMGAMLGFMARPFDTSILMIFFFGVIMLLMGETVYMIYKSIEKKTPKSYFAIFGFGILVLVLFNSFFMDYSIEESNVQAFVKLNQPGFGTGANNAQAQQVAGLQEVSIKMTANGYAPNRITVKKGIPVKINFFAESNAGCSRSVTFPDFNVKKIVQTNTSDFVEFTPEKEGTFQFYCAMGMFRGELIVQA